MTASKGKDVTVGTSVVSAALPEAGDHARAWLYAWLAEVLRAPPTPATLARLITSFPATSVEEPEQAPLQAALQRTRKAASTERLHNLDDEYHALFIGLGRGELMPYSSWYVTGFVMGRPLAQLRSDLQSVGIERQPGVCEPEDHVAALCETMALLADPAEGVSLSVQSHFYNNHLGPWLGRFFKDVQTAPSARFYAAVGALGEAFLDVERRYYEVFAEGP